MIVTMTRIDEPNLDWSEDDIPSSAMFGDVYYNRQNGLDESRLVYLNGNNLPDNWVGKGQFVIAETGFGTGLNFLATCEMFEQTAGPGDTLDYISIERFPMHRDDLAKALAHFNLPHTQRLLNIYPPRIPGFHRRWITPRITLTLIFDDAIRATAQMCHPVDAWFLDGFAPQKNPEMWHEHLFNNMAKLSHEHTTLASFTAVGDVRRALKNSGFTIKRVDGFGYKYHRITGHFSHQKPRPQTIPPKHVHIIGAGLAGAGAAFALQRRGIPCTVSEKAPDTGFGASGNRLGLINPKLEAQDNARNDCGQSAFSFALHLLADMPADITEYRVTGADHFALKPDRKERLLNLGHKQNWLSPHLQLRDGHLWFPDSATVNTRALVRYLLNNVTVRYNTHITIMPNDSPVILGNGYAVQDLLPQFPLQPVRGQVTYARLPQYTQNHIKVFGHYIAPVSDDIFSFGATFQPEDAQADLRDEDNIANLDAIKAVLPELPAAEIVDQWAGIRSATKDRFPLAGKISGVENIYISAALGSHGIQFGLLQGEILACLLCGTVPPIGKDALAALSPDRFLKI